MSAVSRSEIPAPTTGEPPALDSPEFAALLKWETGEDERYVARTDDGWNIQLYRYRAKGLARSVPLLCGHGLAGSRLIYDAHPNYSMARAGDDNHSILYGMHGVGRGRVDFGMRHDRHSSLRHDDR